MSRRCWRPTCVSCCLAVATALFWVPGALGQEDSTTQLRHVHELDARVASLCSAGKYQEAEAVAREALAKKEALAGPSDPDTGTSLNNLAFCLQAQGRYAEAEPLFRRCLALWDSQLEANHPSRPIALSNLGMLYVAMQRYAEAEPLLGRALDLRRQTLGPEDPRTLGSQRNLATLYARTGRDAEAETLLKGILEACERTAGHYDRQTLRAVTALADFYVSKGRAAEATPLQQRVTEAHQRAAGGRGDPRADPAWELEQARQLDRQAEAQRDLGRYEEAIATAAQALARKEKRLGRDHAEVGRSLMVLGQCEMDRGQYGAAETALARALQIAETLPEDDPQRPEALTDLASLYQTLGREAEAAPLLRRALAIREKVLAPADPRIAVSLIDVAGLALRLGQFAEARPILDRALALTGAALGPLDPQTAACYTSLAVLHAGLRVWEGGDGYLRRALAINERAFGCDHPATAATLQDLGAMDCLLGHYTEAEALVRQALDIRERALGPAHLATAESLDTLGELRATAGDSGAALVSLLRGAAIHDAAARQVFAFSAPRHRWDFAQLLSGATDTILTLCARDRASDPSARRAGLQLILNRKAWLLNAELAEAQAQRTADNPRLAERLRDLRAVQERLAKLAYQTPPPGEAEAARAEWIALLRQQDDLESNLARACPQFEARLATTETDLAAVARALPARCALVEIASYRPRLFTAIQDGPAWGEPEYVAYVLRPGEPTPDSIALGPTAPIDRAVDRFRRALSPDASADLVGMVSSGLYHLLWEPLTPALGDAKRVVLSPDGELNLASLAALQTPDGSYLAEQYVLQTVSSGRELVNAAAKGGKEALLLAAPDFTAGSPPGGDAVVAEADKLPPLPDTALEAREVASLLGQAGVKTRVLLGPAATESALREAHGPRWLHIATHGFFLRDPHEAAPAPEPIRTATLCIAVRGQRMLLPGARGDMPFPPFLSDPMHRSGLALAGAQRTLAGHAPLGGGDDGVLTAEEVAGLDLQGTRLVVLSACETGLGEVKRGEGVMGLRRAFATAGAQAVVMSLWNVPDEATRQLMRDFYRVLLQTGDTGVALAQAQRAALRRQRATGTANPWYWGAFIAATAPGR